MQLADRSTLGDSRGGGHSTLSVGITGKEKDNKEAGKRFSSTASSQEGHHAMVKAYADSRTGRRELLAAGYWTQANGIHPGLERLFCYIHR